MEKISHTWLSVLGDLRAAETPCVLITVIESKGSTPRDAGTKMVITKDEQFGTIGGGNLEFQAIEQARALLNNTQDTPEMKDYALGPSLAQCCGGAVTILLEPFFSQKKTLAIFGAGHVGKAMISILQDLPIRIKWIDERAAEFPEHIPNNTEKIITDTPVAELSELPDDSYILVITHNHDLDYDLVKTALKNNHFTYLGMIGSDTKNVKFRKRLLSEEISEARVQDMTCPIGVDGIKGKHPREIAIAVTAELLQQDLTTVQIHTP